MYRVCIHPYCAKLNHLPETINKKDVLLSVSNSETTVNSEVCVGGGRFPSWESPVELDLCSSYVKLLVLCRGDEGEAVLGEASIELKDYEGWVELYSNSKISGQLKIKVACEPCTESAAVPSPPEASPPPVPLAYPTQFPYYYAPNYPYPSYPPQYYQRTYDYQQNYNYPQYFGPPY